MQHSRLDAWKPSAGLPTGQVLYSQGVVNTFGVVVEEPVPDLFTAGHDKMGYITNIGKSVLIQNFK